MACQQRQRARLRTWHDLGKWRAHVSKSKGKARKLAKAQAQARAQNLAGGSNSTAKSSRDNRKEYVLAIKDFSPMASYIAKQEPAVKVPDFFAVAIERVIWARKTFAGKLAEAGANISKAADAKHNYFVGILESVRDTLKPLMEPGLYNMDELKKATAAAAAGGQGAYKDRFQNMYGLLGVYEPSESFLNAPDIVVPKTSEQTLYVAESVDDWSEALFVYVGFLRDLSRLRDEVLSLWDQWAKDELDLTAAAIATNTAFELARTMEDEIRPVLDKQGGGEQVANDYFEVLCEVAGIEIDETTGSHYHESYDIGIESLTFFAEIVAGFVPSAASANRARVKIPPTYNGKFGWYDETLGGAAFSNVGKLLQDKAILAELFPDPDFQARNKQKRTFMPDQLALGLGHLVDRAAKCKSDVWEVPLWFVWALRIYVDVLLRLGKECDKALHQMQDEIYHMKRSVRGISGSGLPGFDKFLESLVGWDQDGMRECRAREVALGLHDRTAIPPDPPYRFLRHNPMYCGLWLLNLRTNFHRFGVHYAAPPAGIMHVAQLYHALRQENLLPENLKWLDLETFRQMQDDSAVMRDRIAEPNATGPVSADVIESILEKGRELATRDGKGFLRADKKDDQKNTTALVPYETTPANVLRQLALDIEVEVLKLKFDYFTMHSTCWDLLLRLKKRFSELLDADISKYLPTTEEHLTFLVGYIFVTASGHSAELPVKLPPRSENRALLDAAAGEMIKFLEEGNTPTKILDGEKKALSDEEKKDLDQVFVKYQVNNDVAYEEVRRQMGRLGVRSRMHRDDHRDDDMEMGLGQALNGALGGIFREVLRGRGIDPDRFGR